MANRRVTLVRNCKTPDGWRRYPAAFGKNGRIKPHVVIVGGREQRFPEGVYQLRTYEGSPNDLQTRWDERSGRCRRS